MSSPIFIEEVRKTKKNEPKVFPSLLTVDREAFGKIEEQAFILKTFWKSQNNKIIVAKSTISNPFGILMVYKKNVDVIKENFMIKTTLPCLSLFRQAKVEKESRVLPPGFIKKTGKFNTPQFS